LNFHAEHPVLGLTLPTALPAVPRPTRAVDCWTAAATDVADDVLTLIFSTLLHPLIHGTAEAAPTPSPTIAAPAINADTAIRAVAALPAATKLRP
jgi:hypothetical protein